MTVIWSDGSGILQTFTLSGSPTAFAATVLTIPPGTYEHILVASMIEAFPSTHLTSNTITIELRDSASALIASADTTTGVGTAGIYWSNDQLSLATVLASGGTIRISGSWSTDATLAVAGRIVAIADNVVFAPVGSFTDFGLTEASHNNDAAGSFSSTFDPHQFDNPLPPFPTFWLLQTLYSFQAQRAIEEDNGTYNPAPAGLIPSVSGTSWASLGGNTNGMFDPYTQLTTGTDPAPHAVAVFSLTIAASGTLPASPTYFTTRWTITDTVGGNTSSTVLQLRARNSGGTIIGSSGTVSSVGTGNEVLTVPFSLPAGTDSVTCDVVFNVVPNNLQLDWMARTYCNNVGGVSGAPNYYSTNVGIYSGSLTGSSIPYSFTYMSTTDVLHDPNASANSINVVFGGNLNSATPRVTGRSFAIVIA